MGRSKSLLPHPSGRTYLQHAIARLRQIDGIERVSVSAAADSSHLSLEPVKSNEEFGDATILLDQHPDRGPISGLISGLRWAQKERVAGCLFTPVDVPDLTVADCQPMVTAFQSQPDRIISAVAVGGCRPEPLIAVYPTALYHELVAFEAAGERSPALFLQQLQQWFPRRAFLKISICRSHLRNVNLPHEVD